MLGVTGIKILVFTFVSYFSWFSSIPFAHAQVAADPNTVEAVMDSVAEQLFSTIEKNRTTYQRWREKFKGPRQAALWPFQGENTPVPLPLLNSWNESLLDALIRNSPNYVRFVARKDLANIIADGQNTDFSRDLADVTAEVLSKAKSDILIIGRVAPSKGGVKLSYRAVDKDGGIVGTTSQHFLKIQQQSFQEIQAQFNLDSAIKAAASELASAGGELNLIRLGGMIDVDSRTQTSFGRLFIRRLADTLQKKMSNEVTQNFIAIDDAELKVSDIRSLSKGVGSKAVVMKDKVAGMLAGAKKGSYFLAGEYWNFEAHVDARISLRDAAGAGPVWNGKISKAGLASKLFNGSRKNPWNSMDGLGGGPLGLELTSTKGKNPVYRVGQSLVLLIKGSDDFFLNCFYHDANGQIFKIFPNKHYTDVKIKKNTLFRIPNQLMGFEFKVQPPVGNENVVCFATNKSVRHLLPPFIADKDLEPIPATIAKRLVGIYNRLPGVKLSQATMNITVE